MQAALIRAWAVAAVLLAPACAHALPTQTWVVTIGNNRGDPDEVQLRYAQRDADAIGGVLQRLGGVSPTRVIRVNDASADQVRDTLQQVHQQLSLVPPSQPTALFVYYSGHADADALHLGGTHLPFKELRTLVTESPAKARLLVIDACRSGGASRVKGARAAQPFKLDVIEAVTEGMAIITSSTADEASQESDRLGGSFFSHHFVNGMRGAADRNEDGDVTLAEAYGYAYDETIRSSGKTLELQHPTYAWDLKGRGELVLTRLSADAQRSGTVRLADSAVYLVTANGRLAAEIKPPGRNAKISLPPQTYEIQQRGRDAYLNYRFELKPGQTVALADLPAKATRYDVLVRKGGGDRIAVHGLTVMGGIRGLIIEGEGIHPQVAVGYTLDLPWFSAGLRLRGTTRTHVDAQGHAPRRHSEVGLMLTLQRYIDLPWFSLGLGALMEAAGHQQVFEDAGQATRRTLSGSFGLLAGIERRLWDGLSVRFEGGPMATVFKGSSAKLGAEVDARYQSPVSGWAALGVIWRL